MNRDSTTGICNEKKTDELPSNKKPMNETLDFLKMFARAYSAKQTLQSEVITICLN